MSYLLIVNRFELNGFSAIQNKYIIISIIIILRFGACYYQTVGSTKCDLHCFENYAFYKRGT